MRHQLSPSLVLSAVALFAALAGTADAVVERVAPQARCATGAVRGAIDVDAEPNFPDTFTTRNIRSSFNCARGGVQVRRIAQGAYDVRFPNNRGRWIVVNTNGRVSSPSAHDYDNFASWDHARDGAFRVFLWDADANPIDVDFNVLLY
jgi:hypothetical protein